MKRKKIIAFISAIVTSLIASYIFWVLVSSDNNEYQPRPLPMGSWVNSCQNPRWANVNQTIFTASCKTRGGDYIPTKIDMGDCTGNQVWNDNGVLKCGNG